MFQTLSFEIFDFLTVITSAFVESIKVCSTERQINGIQKGLS